ncbi:APC family permease [bacterium]|nr:APC family permease [bacterium]
MAQDLPPEATPGPADRSDRGAPLPSGCSAEPAEKGPAHFTLSQGASEGAPFFGRTLLRFKHFLIGRPLATLQLPHERIPKWKALAVLSSDALSSVAYATEEILLVLVVAGTASLGLSLPIAGAIALLLAAVAFSYRQTIFHYPQGGGTYTVTKDNLGLRPALVAGSSLMVDYVLTVAVSVSSGVAAVTSAFPALHPYKAPLAVGVVVLLTLANLRGTRESATIFVLPTYFFIGSMFVLLGLGAWKIALGAPPVEATTEATRSASEAIGVFLVLRAFASGCTAMTGTEAISNGIPIFREPQSRNAATTLSWMAALLALFFLGITFLAQHYAIHPAPEETVVSQLTRAIAGHGVLYYAVQASTALILLLAANTSYADFPRLANFMAQDGFLPKQFTYFGDRLAYSTGIIVLGLLSGLLVALFRADTHALIPLYAVGVFVAFTLSQASMAWRWWSRREPGWPRGLVINGVGALATGIVSLVVVVTKFVHGAWIIVLLIPLMVAAFSWVRTYYQCIERVLALDPDARAFGPLKPGWVVVPVSGLNKAGVNTVRLALALSERVTLVHVTDRPEEGDRVQSEWQRHFPALPFVIVESPYRMLVSPIIAYLRACRPQAPAGPILVVLTELVPQRWWQYVLFNLDALKFKLALFFMPRVNVVDAPFHLEEEG